MSALTDLFENIADAIRAKEGSSGTIVASTFPTRIANLPLVNSDSRFLESIAPKHWDTKIAQGTKYSTVDSYGTWTIEANSYGGADSQVYGAFDTTKLGNGASNDTEWISGDMSEHAEYDPAVVTLTFPILIKPTLVTIQTSSNKRTTASIYFSTSTSGDDWELLGSTSLETASTPIAVAISTNTFYRRMKISAPRPEADYKMSIQNLEITSGYWKEA